MQAQTERNRLRPRRGLSGGELFLQRVSCPESVPQRRVRRNLRQPVAPWRLFWRNLRWAVLPERRILRHL